MLLHLLEEDLLTIASLDGVAREWEVSPDVGQSDIYEVLDPAYEGNPINLAELKKAQES